ncbi:winged helix-turn-helix transcriptional regulator [Rhodococcus sp. AG1013]|uniref:winged helix-turn-helix transcriptional regulator n=1 Tax=Rhodococcus sp. AG1013 TaxID=2183996 RepID=UPI002852EA01|nr:winged helix-turn-helix transcriptional regulator [Rhodococcus sp. AG1013]
MSNSVLTGRLAWLTDAGLLDKVVFPIASARPEYLLTDRGRAVWPILAAMWSWEREWAPDGPAGLLRVRHVDCGAEFTPVMVCARCREPAGVDDVTASLGPSGGASRSIPAAASRRRTGAARRRAQLPHTMELVGSRWSAALLGAARSGRRGSGCSRSGRARRRPSWRIVCGSSPNSAC